MINASCYALVIAIKSEETGLASVKVSLVVELAKADTSERLESKLAAGLSNV